MTKHVYHFPHKGGMWKRGVPLVRHLYLRLLLDIEDVARTGMDCLQGGRRKGGFMKTERLRVP